MDRSSGRSAYRRVASRDLVLFAVLAVFGAAALAMIGLGGAGALGIAAAAIAVAILTSAAAVVSLRRWRGMDEAEREASAHSWTVGGGAGLVAGGMGMLIGTTPLGASIHVPSIFGREDPVVYMTAGALLLTFLMMAGHATAQALWWRRRR